MASINIAFVDGANFSPRRPIEENSPEETADSSDKKRNAEVSDQPMVSADSSSEIRSPTAEHGGSETSISRGVRPMNTIRHGFMIIFRHENALLVACAACRRLFSSLIWAFGGH